MPKILAGAVAAVLVTLGLSTVSAAPAQAAPTRVAAAEGAFDALTYNIAESYALLVGYDHLFTGSFFKNASGSGADGHYGYAMLQFNLEKSKLKAPKKGV